MAEVFTHVAAASFTRNSKARIRIAQFGDGYSQRIREGINTQDDTWELSFVNRSISDAASIISFLESKHGSDYFLWTPPGDTTQFKVICDSWNTVYASPISRTISCTFKRVFDLV